MKKICGVLMVLFAFFASVLPAQAKGKHSEVLVSAGVPTYVLPGSTFDVVLSAEKVGQKMWGEQKVLLNFNTLSVKSVMCHDMQKRFFGFEQANSLKYEWKFKLSVWRPKTQLKCAVTLRQINSGRVLLLDLFDKKAELKLPAVYVNVLSPRLTLETFSPASVKVGEVPFDVVVKATNNSPVDLPIDLKVLVYFQNGATNRNIMYAPPVSGLLGFQADAYGAVFHWTGTIKAGKVDSLTINLQSAKAGSAILGQHPLYSYLNNITGMASPVRMIELLP